MEKCNKDKDRQEVDQLVVISFVVSCRDDSKHNSVITASPPQLLMDSHTHGAPQSSFPFCLSRDQESFCGGQ